MYRRTGFGAAAAGTTDAATSANCFGEYATYLAQYGPLASTIMTAIDPNCASVLYQEAQYGTLPAVPQAFASATPTPPTQTAVDSQTPDQTAQNLAASLNANSTAAAQQAIADAIANGTYNPAGNVPTPPGLDSSTWILIGLAVAGGLILLMVVRH